jgi:hypothetical protein
MNRRFVLLAASMLATGCVSSDSCDLHTVFVAWPSFVRATSTGYLTTSSCQDVARVDVFVDDATTPISANCTDDVVVVSLLTGGHRATVEAIGTDGFPLLRDAVSFTITDSCVDQQVNTQPGEGVVTVNYDFGGPACVAGSVIWFNVHDDVANVDIAGVNGASGNPARYACNASHLPAFALPAGSYTLDYMEEAFFTSGAYEVSAAYCRPTTFSVDSGIDTSTPSVPMVVDAPACQ